MTPTPLRAFKIFSVIWLENVSFESRVSPKCLCSFTLYTIELQKRVVGDPDDSVYGKILSREQV